MAFMTIVIYLVIYCIQGYVWGWAVNKIIENKGYRENWFWWGFFFGFIAFLVALTKPDVPRTTSNTGSYFGEGDSIIGKDYVFRGFGYEGKTTDVPGGWRCSHCGKINASYVGTCGCGWDKSGNTHINIRSSGQTQQNTQTTQPQQPQILYCTSCGKQMELDSKFCRYCGAEAK